ncbi:MAG TPA: hypothetical protein VGO00_08830, partial [Kofleriaceae bacterium]|nr:hypothetical protein [Kofleriaceae bacterium]
PTADDQDNDARATSSDHNRDRIPAETSGQLDDHDAGLRGHESHDHAHVHVSAEPSDPTADDQDNDARATASDHSRDRVSAETSGQTDDHDGSRHDLDTVGDPVSAETSGQTDDRDGGRVSAETSDQSNDHDAGLRGHESNDHAHVHVSAERSDPTADDRDDSVRATASDGVSAETSGQTDDAHHGDGTDDPPIADHEIELHASLKDPRVIGYAAGSVDLDSLETVSDEPSDVEALAEAAVDELGASDTSTGTPNVDPVASAPDTDERTRRGS